MKADIKQLIEQYANCPSETSVYEIDGKIYTVVSHFTGDKDIKKVIAALAESRAKREMGLNE